MTETTIITTQIRSGTDDFDIRPEFCGVQDQRLNDLRQFSSCIIDLQTHGLKDPFEKVTWVISHYDEGVRAFVVKRIQAWAKTTQIAAQMHAEDLVFQQQALSDSSSGSLDMKVHQVGNSIKSSPTNSVPLMFNKHSKTPSHDHHFGSVPNAALVPQTDIQPRHQQRRRRNSSSSSAGIPRPALFGKPSDYYLSRRNDYIQNHLIPLSTPRTETKSNEITKALNEDGLSLLKPSNLELEKEYSYDLSKDQDKENNSGNNEYDATDYEEEARWENVLTDTSDYEDDVHPLMADIIQVSQLRDCLVNSRLSLTDDIEYIQSLFPVSLSVTAHEKSKKLNNQAVWFYRLILNSKILLSNGVHKSKEKAQRLAYHKLIELMTNKQGVEVKVIGGGKCKVTVRKYLPPKPLNETTIMDSTMSITTNEFSNN